MTNVVQFGRKPIPTEAHGDLLLTVNIYDTPGYTDYVIRRFDGVHPTDDLDTVIDKVDRVVTSLHLDRYERTQQPEHDLKLTVRIFASSDIRCNWFDDDLVEPDGLAWLHRRLGDAYWSLDPRRGVAYHWHILRGKLRNFLLHQSKDEQK